MLKNGYDGFGAFVRRRTRKLRGIRAQENDGIFRRFGFGFSELQANFDLLFGQLIFNGHRGFPRLHFPTITGRVASAEQFPAQFQSGPVKIEQTAMLTLRNFLGPTFFPDRRGR
jgi:hypothetical protein